MKAIETEVQTLPADVPNIQDFGPKFLPSRSPQSQEWRVAILVLGMHRSGTSALTGMLNMLGAAVPSELLDSGDDNRKGFFEGQRIVGFDERLLGTFESRWDDPLPLSKFRFDSATAGKAAEELGTILENEFGNQPIALIKDPRICRLLPVWLEALARAHRRAVAVLSLRHPLEVVASLRQRNSFSGPHTLALWLQHVLRAERDTRAVPRCFTLYDDLLNDWRLVARKISEELGIAWPHGRLRLEDQIDAFVSSELCHHSACNDDLDTQDALQALCARTWKALKLLVSDARSFEAQRMLDEVAAELESALSVFGSLIGSLDRGLAQASNSLLAKEQAIFALNQAATEHETQIASLRNATAAAEGRVEELEDALADERQHGAELDRALRTSQTDREALEAALAEERRHSAEIALRVAEQAATAAQPSPAVAQLDPRLIEELEQLRRERVILMHSTAWRVAAGLRVLAHYIPRGMRRPLFRTLRRAWSIAKLPSRQRWAQRHMLRRISDSGLFDAEWYAREYPDVAAAGIDPLWHYAIHGTADRRNPSAGFDAGWYLAAYPDVAASGLNPLLHYVRSGRAEGRLVRPIARGAAEEPAQADDAASRARQRRRNLGLDLVPAPVADVAVGIVTFNSPELELRRAIAAAEASLRLAGSPTAARIFVIDNGAPSTAAGDGDSLCRLPSRGNIGFGAGHNVLMQAAFAAGAEFYVALNPDGLLHPEAVDAMVRMLRASEGHALVEALQFPEEHPKIYDPVSFDTPWASGACLAIPRSVHQAIGGFDDGFFMYCEDVDLSWRARAAGFAVKICPPALFLHHTANRAVSDATRRMFLASGRRLALKWGNPQFADGCAKELAAAGALVTSDYIEQVPLGHRAIADFSHLFHFAPARW